MGLFGEGECSGTMVVVAKVRITILRAQKNCGNRQAPMATIWGKEDARRLVLCGKRETVGGAGHCLMFACYVSLIDEHFAALGLQELRNEHKRQATSKTPL